MKINKKRITLVFLTGLITMGGTYALLFTKTEQKINTFNIGKVNVGVVENGVTYEQNTGQEISSGTTTYEKSVAIKNIDTDKYRTVDTYVRVRLVPMWVYDGGNHAGEVIAASVSNVSYTLANTDKWIKHNGYYYYINALAPNAVTEELITEVAYTAKPVEDANLEVDVLVEGIQSKVGEKPYALALEAWGLTSNPGLTENVKK